MRHKNTLISLLIIIPAGFLFKFYPGPGRHFVNNSLAGALYEIFWCLAVFFFLPRKEYIVRIALAVFMVTCALELLQLWHPWFLEQVRSTFIGRTIIGTTFCWWDFLYYLVGCVIGLFWMRIIYFSNSKSINLGC